jgi:hypothetical protein
MKLEKLSAQECIDAIQEGKHFYADVADGAFTVKIKNYSYFVCAAIHDGHNLRNELTGNCALNEDARLYEEDPHTGELISSLPITMIARDSRYEYDLNRPPQTCVYEEAWGKPVWLSPLSDEEKLLSLKKHETFYRVLGVLLEKVQAQFGSCLVYDIHSYNFKRIDKDTPAFNVGTEQLDAAKYADVIQHWVTALDSISVPEQNLRASADEVFYGRGYLATFVRENFSGALALPTEIKKVFMDELTGKVDSKVLPALKTLFEKSSMENSDYFSKSHIHK